MADVRNGLKKPLSNWALVMVGLAVTYALLGVPGVVEILRQPHTLQNSLAYHDATYIQSFQSRDIIGSIRSTLWGSGTLLALAVLIELVDRIRWNALPLEQRGQS